MSTSYNNNNYVESGRVYLKLGDPSAIVIKCCLCSTAGLADWAQFVSHLTTCHTAGTRLEKRNLALDEEIQAEVELEQQNLSKVTDEDNLQSTESEVESDEEVEDDEYLNKGDEIDEEEIGQEVQVNQNKIFSKPNQPFYSLLHTKPELMLYFIDLLRQHEFLWDEKYRNRGFKTERLESAQKLSQALEERFNVALRPEVICKSACTLLQWFDKQHALHKSKRGFRARYKAYYDKLLEFVPTQNIEMLNCDECKRHFYNDEQLRRHKFRVHKGSCPYVCDVCQTGFLYACKLRMHRARFHEKPTRWQCTLCSYCAPNSWDLRAHMPTHSGERNYTCELCGISTKSSSALAVHRRTHSSVKKSCPYCPKKYRENYILKCHIKKVHAAEHEEEQES